MRKILFVLFIGMLIGSDLYSQKRVLLNDEQKTINAIANNTNSKLPLFDKSTQITFTKCYSLSNKTIVYCYKYPVGINYVSNDDKDAIRKQIINQWKRGFVIGSKIETGSPENYDLESLKKLNATLVYKYFSNKSNQHPICEVTILPSDYQ